MADSLQQTELRLAHAYEQQLVHYDAAYEVLRQRETQPSDANPDWITNLEAALGGAKALDLAIAADKAEWQSSGRSPAPAFRKILRQLTERIHAVSQLVDKNIEVLQQERQRLLPETDDFGRQRRMLRAYDLHSKGSNRPTHDGVSA